MKILVLCNKSPWPKQEGGPIAMHAMISGLLQSGHSVKVISANTNKFHVDPASLPEDFVQKTNIEFVDLNLSVNIPGAIYNLLTGRSYHVSRFHTKAFEQKIIEALKKETYDIIHLEMLYMASYLDVIRAHSKAPVVLRAHNIEHKIWQRISENTHFLPKRLYIRSLYKSLKRFEISILDKVDGIIAITPVDARNFAKITSNRNIISIPFGLSIPGLPEDHKQPDNSILFHIGAMNWFPNEEGIRWLINEVWPKLSAKLPEATLHLAGRYMPDWLKNLAVRNIIIDGEIPDVWDYMHKYSIMVVPLFSGSGIRIKIVEGMAAGKAIITTTIGAEGINYENERDLIIAKDANSFAEAIIKLYSNAELRQSLGENAYKLMLRDHDNVKLMVKLTEFYKDLLSNTPKIKN